MGWRLIAHYLQSCLYRFHMLCNIPEKHRGQSATVQNKQNLDQNVLKQKALDSELVGSLDIQKCNFKADMHMQEPNWVKPSVASERHCREGGWEGRKQTLIGVWFISECILRKTNRWL